MNTSFFSTYSVNPSISIFGVKSNHLGNVLNVITDRKLPINSPQNKVDYYTADVVSYSDYMPFGALMEGRHGYEGKKASHGFQGQLVDDEIKGEGNSVNYKYRMHDPRLGRFFAVDPLAKDFPHNSSYAFSENRVLDANELEGLEAASIHNNISFGISATLGKVDNAIKINASYNFKLIAQVGTFELGGKFEYSLYSKQKGIKEKGVGKAATGYVGIGFGKPVGGTEINFSGSGVTFPGSGSGNDGAPVTVGYGSTLFSSHLQGSDLSQRVGTYFMRIDTRESSTTVSTSNDLFGDKGDRVETAGFNLVSTRFLGNSQKIQAGLNLRLLTQSPIMVNGERSVNGAPNMGPNGTYNSTGPQINGSSSVTLSGAYSNPMFNLNANIGLYGSGVANVFQNKLIHDLMGFPRFNNPKGATLGGSVEAGKSAGTSYGGNL